jgi:hypothetical protein
MAGVWFSIEDCPQMFIEPDGPPIDLAAPGMRKALAAQLMADIDAFSKIAFDDGHRKHLGASIIGHDCDRYLWSVFRWLKPGNHDGRMKRLFNRGHREEAAFLHLLRGIGLQVWDVADDGSQHRVKACGGHFGGSLDGISRLPPRYRVNKPLLCEFKTSGTGAKFANLCKYGVAKEKPQHFKQMSIYGKHYGFEYALYMAVNKNDDAIHLEIVKLDWTLAVEMETRAQNIILSPFPPAKVSENPAFLNCKNCEFAGICHAEDAPDKSCRSCMNAAPAPEGKWFCKQYQQTIPEEVIPVGCGVWASVTG